MRISSWMVQALGQPMTLYERDESPSAGEMSTPYQTVVRSGLQPGDVAVFVALGGVGGFDVQLAAAIDPQRLDALENYGAAFTLRADDLDPKDLKKQVRAFADERGVPSWRQKIFETSGTTAGQSTAFRLLGPLQHLSILPRAARRPWDTQSPCTS